MRITRNPTPAPVQGSSRPATPGWLRGVVLSALLALAFAAGAWGYRQGYVSRAIALMRGISNGETPALPAPLQEAVQEVEAEARLYTENGLPTLYLDVPFKSYQKLTEKRAEALKIGILLSSDEDLVPARLHLQGQKEVDIEMRLKGDWTDHIEGDKWSFRIKTDEYVNKMREFSIQSPETRQFAREWVFHRLLMQEGIMTTRYDFYNVVINGEAKGIYALEEHFTQDMIEAQGRRAGVIIRFDEEILWQNRAAFRQNGTDSESVFTALDIGSANISPFGAGKIAKSPTLSAEAGDAMGKLRAYQAGKLPASAVFDTQLMGRFYALSDLWGACHGTYWINLRFYYNPVTSLLEPVVFDAEPFNCGGNATAALRNTNPITAEFIRNHDHIFNDPLVRQAYAVELARITQSEYLGDMRRTLQPESDRMIAALRTEYQNDDLLDIPWELIKRRGERLRQELAPSQPLRGSFQITSEPKPALQIDLVNLMILPVELLRVEIDGQTLQPDATWSLPEEGLLHRNDQPTPALLPVIDPAGADFPTVRFSIPYQPPANTAVDEEKEAPVVHAIVRLAGLPQEYSVNLNNTPIPQPLVDGPRPPFPALQEALNQHPFLSLAGDGKSLWVKPGDWNVSGDLVLPAGLGLNVPAGTTLRFGKDNFLLAGGAVNLLGDESAPVLLTAQKDGWQGVVVLEAAQPSVWKYATAENMTGVARGGWLLTSSITFYKSNITLQNARLLHAQSEDVINVIHGEFLYDHSEFAYSASDAFDSDYSPGRIVGCSFHDIGADAIDISGAAVTVEDTTAVRITDKGISAGEHSEITARNFTVDTVGIGIASKDQSLVIADQIVIRNAQKLALAAYQKKEVYGPSKMEITHLTVENVTRYSLIQDGSTASVDGRLLETEPVDVAKLYKNGYLGN